MKKKPDPLNDDATIATAADTEIGEPSMDDHTKANTETDSQIQSVDDVGTMLEVNVQAHDGFDPLIHAVNDDGTPKRKVDGSYALKRGRKMGTSSTSANPSSANPTSTNPSPTINVDESARQACNILINGSVALFGEQWAPQDKAEAEGLKTSFKNYFEARGVPNIPPEMGLAVAVLAYSLPRIGHERTISRFQALKLRLFDIYKAIRGK